LATDGGLGLVVVTPGDGDFLVAEIRLPQVQALPAVIARIRRVFDLSADPGLIGERLSQDPALAPLVAARPGLRAPGAWDGFELAVRAILGQQVSVEAARRLAGRLTERFGGEVDAAAVSSLGLTRAFPTPERLVGQDIAALGMPNARGAALEALARTVVDDRAVFSPRADLDSAVAALRSLPGVGDWTAHYIALRELREPDAFPHGDVALHRAYAAAAEAARPTPRELLLVAEAWRPWRAYAAQHLWAADAARRPTERTKTDAKRAA
jgi:AraC family transcriptional regulator of adaptative response / DNA-3-methyladenine glycosylase II